MKFRDIKSGVVVPWDFSALSRKALEQAVQMTEDRSLIHVIHVTEYPSAYEFGMVGPTATDAEIAGRLNELFQENVADDPNLAGLKLTVRFGNPGVQVCEFAGKIDAELIIMPSHGRSGFSRLLLGSVAERVLRLAPCPVLVLRQNTLDEEADTDDSQVASVPQ